MKKFFSLLGLLMLLFSSDVWGYTPTLTENYSVTGYLSKAYYNISNSNVGDMCPASGDLRFRGSGYGLFNFGSGNRGADIALAASSTDLILFEFKDSQNRNVTINSVANCTKNDNVSSGDILAYDVTADFTSTNINVGRAGCIIAILVLEKDNSAATADYTINYKANGNTVKTETGNVAVGTKLPIQSSFFVESTKYLKNSGEADEYEVVAGANVVTINVSEAPKFTYSVNDNLGNELANSSAYEGDKVTFYVPYYAFKGGKFYQSPTLSSGTLSYGQGTISAISGNTNVTVTYTEEANTKVVFYSEAENLAGITEQNDGFTNIRMSNGAAGYFADPTSIKTLQPGVYTLTAATRSGTTKFTVNGSKEILDLTSSGSVVTATSDEFIISKESAIVATAGNASNYFDYVIIRKVADYVATESLTIADATPEIGKAATLAATIAPANASSKTITWSLDEASKEYAELNAATGELTPLKAGDITIKATNGEKEVEKVITIAPAEFAVTITGAPSEAQVFVGDDASAKDVLSVTTKAGYDQMQNTSLLQPQGSVTATKIPTYIYSITVDKTKKTVDVVYEEDIEVTAMSFEVTDQRIALGNSRTLQVTYYPADASFKTATWTSSNPEVATVDANTGLVTAVSEGETTITATWSENESHGTDYSAQLTLTVDKGLVIDRIVFDELDDATAEVMGYYHPMDGDTLFLAPLIESNGRMIPVSFIKQEAFIGSNLKSIVIPGTVKTIDHRALMYSNTHNAYEELPEDGLESAFLMEGVEVMRDRIFHGNKYMKKVFLPSTLTDIGYYSFFGTAIEDVYFGGSEDEWNALKNLENAKLPETAKIHFNSDFTSAFINSIEVEEESVEIAVGETYAIEATVIPESIAPAIELTYTSSNEEVATVDEEGVVTGIADGYVTITVSAGEGVEAKVRVKVGDPVQERENVLTMDFEDGEVADYWALAIAESQLVEPTAEGSTGRAAAVVSGSDRGDYVKVNADLEGATKYEVAMDLLLTKSPKTTQFCVLNASSWDTWTTNWGMFWKDTKAQSHNPFLFNLDIAGNSNTANVNIDFDADGNAIAAQQTWDFENGVWYTLTLAVDVNAHKVDYTIAAKSDPETALISGTYNAPADENMQIKGIYERNGRYNYSPGAIAIDNVIVDVTERGFVEGQGGNGATGISEAQSNESTVKSGKYMENGQIVIYIDGKKFNAAGQQMK